MFLACGTWSGSIDIWAFPEGQSLYSLPGHNGKVTCITLTPNSEWLITGGEDNSILMWKGPKFRAERIMLSHFNSVVSISLSPDLTLLASGSTDKTLKIWDLIDQKILKSLKRRKAVTSLAFSHDTKFLVAASADHAIRLYNILEDYKEAVLTGHTDIVSMVLISSDNKFIVSSGHDSLIIVWDLENLSQLYQLQGLRSPLLGFTIDPNGRYLYSFSSYASKWNLDTRKCEYSLNNSNASSIALSSDNKKLVTVEEGKVIKVFDVEKQKEIGAIGGHSFEVTCMCMDKEFLVTGGQDGTVRVWNLKTKIQECVFLGHSSWITSVKSSNGLVFTTSKDKTFRVWDIETRQELVKFNRPLLLFLRFTKKISLV